MVGATAVDRTSRRARTDRLGLAPNGIRAQTALEKNMEQRFDAVRGGHKGPAPL
jgi:hypothetical protein